MHKWEETGFHTCYKINLLFKLRFINSLQHIYVKIHYMVLLKTCEEPRMQILQMQFLGGAVCAHFALSTPLG